MIMTISHMSLAGCRAPQVALVVKNPPANSGDVSDAGSIPRLGRSSREGNDQPLQYSFLENPMNRGAWWATVHGVTKSWTRLSETHTNTHTNTESGTWGQEKGIWLPSYIWTITSILSIFLEQRWGPISNIFWQDKIFEVGFRKGMLWTECLPKILMLKP